MRETIRHLADAFSLLLFACAGLTFSAYIVFGEPGATLDNPGQWFLCLSLGFLASFYLALIAYFVGGLVGAGVMAAWTGIQKARRFIHGALQAHCKNTR